MTTPAVQVIQAAATIPAFTDPAAPVTVDVSFGDATVSAIRWRVPPGPSGLMGWQLTSDGAGVIPLGTGTYIVADNEWDRIDLTGQLTTGNWQVTGYNTDAYDHTVYLTFYVTPNTMIAAAAASGPQSAPAAPNDTISPPPPDATSFTAGIQVQT